MRFSLYDIIHHPQDLACTRSRLSAPCSTKRHHLHQCSSRPSPHKLCLSESSADVECRRQSLDYMQQHKVQMVLARAPSLLGLAAAVLLHSQVLVVGHAKGAELLESNLSNEGNIPSELSAAGEQAGPRLSSLMSGSNKKQVESCTRRCVPTCTRGGEGAPGLGPISMRKEIIVFKEGFRSRQYCLSECAQVCSRLNNKEGSSSSGSGSSSSSGSGSSSLAAAAEYSGGKNGR